MPLRWPSLTHRATAFVPVVDTEGFGQRALMELEIQLDGTVALAEPSVAWAGQAAVESDPTLEAIEVALVAALGAEAKQWRARVKRVDLDFPVVGASLGLGVGVAAWAAGRGLQVPPGWAFSGRLSPLGEVRPVHSGTFAEKLLTVASAGVSRLMLAAEQGSERELRAQAQALLSQERDLDEAALEAVEFVFVRHLNPACLRIFPWPARAARVALPLGVGPAFALLGLTQVLDVPLAQQAFIWAHGALQADDVAVLTLRRSADNAEVRELHAERVGQIAAAGADVIVFDLVFRRCALGELESLIEAIEAAPVPVVVGVSAAEGELDGFCDPRLRDVARGGLVNVREERLRLNPLEPRVPFRLGLFPVDDARAPYFALSCEALAARAGQLGGVLRAGRLRCGDTSNPLTGRYISMAPVELPEPADYDDPRTWGDLEGRVVFIGAADRRDRYVTPSGARYGVELQAALTQTLVEGRAPRWHRRWHAVVMALGVEVLGVLMLWTSRRWAIGLSLTICLAALAGSVALSAHAGWIAPVAPALLGLALLWWQAPQLRRLR